MNEIAITKSKGIGEDHYYAQLISYGKIKHTYFTSGKSQAEALGSFVMLFPDIVLAESCKISIETE